MLLGIYAIVNNKRKTGVLHIVSFLALCCVLIATVGGFSAVIATVGALLGGSKAILSQIRGYDRMIVFSGFFSYYASSALLGNLTFRIWRQSKSDKPPSPKVGNGPCLGAAFCACPLGPGSLRDSKFPSRDNQPCQRQRISKMETQLPPRSMIFQYPLIIHHAGSEQLSARYL